VSVYAPHGPFEAGLSGRSGHSTVVERNLNAPSHIKRTYCRLVDQQVRTPLCLIPIDCGFTPIA